MNRATLLATAALASIFTACSSGEISVGTSDQRLVKTKDGSNTGNGKTCSWDDAISYDAATGKETVHSSGDGEYAVGDSFPAPDGCNTCQCTPEGIACTLMYCAPRACQDDAKVCPDGTTLSRTGPNCEFPACPEPEVCTTDVKQCPDGSYVSRTGPNCEFAPCP